MEGLPLGADVYLIGCVAIGIAVAVLITGIQGTVQFVRRGGLENSDPD
jgi:hypothetical protein